MRLTGPGIPALRPWRATARLAPWDLALTLAAAPTLLFPGGWTALGAGLLALAWLGRWAQTGRPSHPTPMDRPLLLLALMTLVGAAVSSFPQASASKLWGIILGICLYYALANRVESDVAQRWSGYGLAALGTGIAGAALLGTDWSYAGLTLPPWLETLYGALPTLIRGLPGSGVPRATDLFNPREVGGSLALLLPVAAVLCWTWRRPIWPRGVLLAGATALMAVVLLLTQTLSALGGVVVALGAAALVAGRARPRWWALGGGGILVLAAVAGWTATSALLAAQPSTTTAPAPAAGEARASFGMAARLELWPRALQMVHDTPYTGIGLNTFPWVMERFYPPFALGPEPHAHNWMLQTGVDLGLPGLIALLWLLASSLVTLCNAYQNGTQETGALALALAAGLFAFLIFGILDAVTLGAKPGVAIWAILGLGATLRPVAAPGDEAVGALQTRLDRGALLLLVVVLLLPATWDGPRLNAGRVLAYRELLRSEDNPADPGALRLAATLLEPAAQGDPSASRSWYLLGSLYGRLGDAEAALSAIRRGVMADSREPLRRYAPAEAWGRSSGQPDWAGLLLVYGQWTTRYPWHAEWHLASAVARCEGLGDLPAAREALERGITQNAPPASLLHAYRQVLVAKGSCSADAG
ncbi:MAG: O-antigen ligase family protein [Chloroflexi bacterium]|nr:O-antigen ligase family protein [Chloroflexota bacterium]